MIINNFSQISYLLTFNNEDEFYFVQILVRGKDKNNVKSNARNRLIRYYTISSLQQFIDSKKEIIDICNACNARAYIHLTKRSYESVARKMMINASEDFYSKQFKALRHAFTSAASTSFIRDDKTYLLDIDNSDIATSKLIDCINYSCKPEGRKLIAQIPTVSGFHLIFKPFDVQEFSKGFPSLSNCVKQNSPTLLYYNKHETN